MIQNKGKEECRVCGHKDTYVIWKESSDNALLENEFFLCHSCGFFCRKYSNKELVEGITVDPKIIPLRQQLNLIRRAIRKNRKALEGLAITDHFPYKPHK